MTNEAAERLREALNETDWDVLAGFGLDFLDAALAAERRATVERIRERLILGDSQPMDYTFDSTIIAVLDEEAER